MEWSHLCTNCATQDQPLGRRRGWMLAGNLLQPGRVSRVSPGNPGLAMGFWPRSRIPSRIPMGFKLVNSAHRPGNDFSSAQHHLGAWHWRGQRARSRSLWALWRALSSPGWQSTSTRSMKIEGQIHRKSKMCVLYSIYWFVVIVFLSYRDFFFFNKALT